MRHLFQVFSFDIVSKAMVGVLGILAIRYMSENQYATYVFALGLSAVVAQTLSASFNRIYLLAYQALGLSVNAASFLGLQLIIIVILSIFGFPFFDKFSWVYFLICALSIATCLTEYAKTFFQRELRFVRFSLVELLRSATFLIGSLAIIWAVGFGLCAWHLLVMQIASMLLIFWVSVGRLVTCKDIIRIRQAISMGKKILHGEFSYLFAYFFLLAIFSQIDILMLKACASNVELATYGSAFRYYAVLSLALGSIHTVLLPVIERADKTQITDILAKHLRLTFGFAFFVMIIAFAASWFMPWIDLGRYPDAVNVFRVLCASTIISFACSPHVNIILQRGRFQFLLILIALALALAISLNIILIPAYGAIGVAFVTLITSAVVNIPVYFQSRLLELRLKNP